jgi:hypothetical protein
MPSLTEFETLSDEEMQHLEKRLGRIHARQRLGIEVESGQRVFGGGLTFFHPENWISSHTVLRHIIRVSGFYGRGRRNACNIQIKHNHIPLAKLDRAFEDFTLLHLSDLHVDMYPAATDALIDKLTKVKYDLCVLTGDYRARTFGTIRTTLEGMRRIAEHLTGPIYGVLGNHDSVRMVPALESYGMHMLLNDSVTISRDAGRFHLAGIDHP